MTINGNEVSTDRLTRREIGEALFANLKDGELVAELTEQEARCLCCLACPDGLVTAMGDSLVAAAVSAGEGEKASFECSYDSSSRTFTAKRVPACHLA